MDLTPYERYALAIALVVMVASLFGFVLGFILADNRRRKDDAFSPTLRTDPTPNPLKP